MFPTSNQVLLSLACASFALGAVAADHGQSIQIPMKDKGWLWDSDIVLEATLYKPQGEGPFPVVIFNHGSTGGDEDYAKQTVNPWGFGKYLNDKNIALVIPMRRGRGGSEGSYKEQYTCSTDGISEGIEYATESLDASYQFILDQPWVDKEKVMLAGNSRGGILSLKFASEHPGAFTGVMNFAGGWVDDSCVAGGVSPNVPIFENAARKLSIPTLFIYGRNDPFYSDESIKTYAMSYENAGGNMDFELYQLGSGASGHDVFYRYYHLWSGVADQYLIETKMDVTR
ncbi:dienelactone hydrolase family protein [Vibrio fortis]|uniref:dienelactone hydrolase family protein n=1 Tax=Vibrio fortis TaxID=212667 RepID=UPI003EBB87A9